MRVVLNFIVATALLAGGCAPADRHESPQSTAPTAATSKARQSRSADTILKSTSDFYAAARSFRVEVVETMSFIDGSGSHDMTVGHGRRVVSMARPNRVSLPGIDAKGLSFHADGQHLWTVLGNRFSREACPESMSQIADDPMRRSLLQLSSRFLLNLFSEDAQEAITRDVESVTVLEDESLDGHLMHHLQFVHPEFDWELWVAVDEPHVIYQVVYDMSKQLGVGLADSDTARVMTKTRFENWQIDPPLDETAFTYQPADGAQWVEHVMRVAR